MKKKSVSQSAFNTEDKMKTVDDESTHTIAGWLARERPHAAAQRLLAEPRLTRARI